MTRCSTNIRTHLSWLETSKRNIPPNTRPPDDKAVASGRTAAIDLSSFYRKLPPLPTITKMSAHSTPAHSLLGIANRDRISSSASNINTNSHKTTGTTTSSRPLSLPTVNRRITENLSTGQSTPTRLSLRKTDVHTNIPDNTTTKTTNGEHNHSSTPVDGFIDLTDGDYGEAGPASPAVRPADTLVQVPDSVGKKRISPESSVVSGKRRKLSAPPATDRDEYSDIDDEAVASLVIGDADEDILADSTNSTDNADLVVQATFETPKPASASDHAGQSSAKELLDKFTVLSCKKLQLMQDRLSIAESYNISESIRREMATNLQPKWDALVAEWQTCHDKLQLFLKTPNNNNNETSVSQRQSEVPQFTNNFDQSSAETPCYTRPQIPMREPLRQAPTTSDVSITDESRMVEDESATERLIPEAPSFRRSSFSSIDSEYVPSSFSSSPHSRPQAIPAREEHVTTGQIVEARDADKNVITLFSDDPPYEDEDIIGISSPEALAPKPYNNVDIVANTLDHEAVEIFDDDDFVASQTVESVMPRDPSLISYPWSQEVLDVLKNVFKLPGFRTNQIEAINATLSGQDVFVLMPTGGGKSLCYQLPALVQSGKTRGTTIVVSPLISLMQDQVGSLKQKGINAEMINSRGDASTRKAIFRSFETGELPLLYISPEMLNTNIMLQNAIAHLHSNNMLSRIVIDEAHCVSSWGHDFRPDYKQLGMFKTHYPSVPVIALTATANERVQLDIRHNLGLKNCAFFKQSFNRANLFYEVRNKTKMVLEEIRDLMQKRFKGKSGIIYCHSKMSCEKTAEKLREFGLRVAHYHAGMDPEDRSQVQNAWQKGTYQAICATIAFGMGIDKPDVRFVVHHYLPRNLEGYYQETGRAGRDGLPSLCLLFYAYRDASSMMTMIERDTEISDQQREKHKDFLRQTIQYCENKTDCRRFQVLRYFNELFESKDCHKTCDNCKNGGSTKFQMCDMTSSASLVIKMVRGMVESGAKVTMLQCIDVFRGSKNSKVMSSRFDQLDEYGAGAKLERTSIDRLFHHLITENALQEYSVFNKAGFASSYVKLGYSHSSILQGRKKVMMPIAKLPSRESNKAPSAQNPTGKARTSASKARSKTTAKDRHALDRLNLNEFAYNNEDDPFQDDIESSIETTARPRPRPLVLKKNDNADGSAKAFDVYAHGELSSLLSDKANELQIFSKEKICSKKTLLEMARTLPVSKETFDKLPDLTVAQQQYYRIFSPLLERLAREKEQNLGSFQRPEVTENIESPHFNNKDKPKKPSNGRFQARPRIPTGARPGRGNGQTRGSTSTRRAPKKSQPHKKATSSGIAVMP